VVVALLGSDLYLLFVVPCISGRLQKVFGEQLSLLVKVVARAIVYQDVNGLHAFPDEFSRIVLFLGFFNAALEIAFERLLPPWAIDGVADRREGRRRAVLVRPGGEVQGEGAMAPHAVPENRLACEIDRDADGLEHLRQLKGDMCEHVVVLRELGVCRVEVEPGAGAKVPIGIFAVDSSAAG